MYLNLEDKEILKTFPSPVLSDNFGSEKEKSKNVQENHKTKNYKWNKEVMNGVDYNRLEKVKNNLKFSHIQRKFPMNIKMKMVQWK